MSHTENKMIGIVGGMGPEAGLVLFSNILKHTPASKDQEHLPVILMSFPGDIVDRTAFYEKKTLINPAFKIAEVVLKLEEAGAQIAGIACNTSHVPEIFEEIIAKLKQANSKIKLLHMPDETVNYLQRNHGDIKRVGLMTTNGMYKSALYARLLCKAGFDVVLPDEDFQNSVIHEMIYNSIYGIKANPARVTTEAAELAARSINFFRQNNAQAVILGCTELSFIKDMQPASGLLMVDSNESLAMALVKEARCGNNS